MAVTAMIMKTAAPKFGKPGDIIPIIITAKQTSEWLADWLHGDNFEYRIFRGDKQIQSQGVNLPNNQEVNSTIKVQMPGSDLTLKIELWYNELRYISERKVDETLITIAEGNTTTTPEEEDETKTNPWDKLFSDIDKTVITVLVILIVVLVFYYFIIQPKKGK